MRWRLRRRSLRRRERRTKERLKEERRNQHANRCEVLVMTASGMVQEDLRQIREAKTGAGELKTLLLGAPQNEMELLQYLRAGVSGILTPEAIAEEVKNGQAICPGVQWAILFRYIEKEAGAFPSATLHGDLGLTRREQQLIPLPDAGADQQRDREPFFTFGADREEPSLPDEAESGSERPAGNCGRLPAARISCLIVLNDSKNHGLVNVTFTAELCDSSCAEFCGAG